MLVAESFLYHTLSQLRRRFMWSPVVNEQPLCRSRGGNVVGFHIHPACVVLERMIRGKFCGKYHHPICRSSGLNELLKFVREHRVSP